jgi:hypothetical protein
MNYDSKTDREGAGPSVADSSLLGTPLLTMEKNLQARRPGA